MAVLAQAITVKIDKLDKALRVWAVRKYKLKQTNPPTYEKVWQSDDIAVVRAWELFKDKFISLRKRLVDKNYPKEAMRAVDSFDVSMVEWDRKFRSMGVDPNEEVDDKPAEKKEEVSIVGTAVAVSMLGIGAYFAAPAIKTLLFPDPKVRQQKPIDVEDIASRILPRRRPYSEKPAKGILPELKEIMEEDSEVEKAKLLGMGNHPGGQFEMVEEDDD